MVSLGHSCVCLGCLQEYERNIQKSTSFFPVGVLVAFSKYEFKPEKSEVALVVTP